MDYELSKISAKHDTATPEGKIEALKEAVNLLAEMKNLPEREIWAAKLAADYGATKEGVLSQVQAKIRRRAKAETKRVLSPAAFNRETAMIVPEKLKNPAAAAAEERLLGAAFRHPEAIKNIMLKISGEDFTCALYRRLFAKMAEAFAAGYDMNLSIFGGDFSLEEQNAAAKIMNGAREHQYSAEDAEDAAKTMLRLRDKKSDSEIAALEGPAPADYIDKMRKEKRGK